MSEGIRRRLGYARWWVSQFVKTAPYRLPTPWSRRFIAAFWESRADAIHERWGQGDHDLPVLERLLAVHRPRSILDVGCGSGRLFGLYEQHQIHDVVGVDISTRALALARERFPGVPTVCGRLEELDFPPGRFDLAICNRVLQHIPVHAVAGAVDTLCRMCRQVYINELTPGEGEPENFYMTCHDYAQLFARQGLAPLEEGRVGRQTYQLYGRRG